ncbi:MAG: response regulator [Pseudomonadota bacterium]
MSTSSLRSSPTLDVETLGNELRKPIQKVLNRVNRLSLQVKQGSFDDKEQMLTDLGKIENATKQLSRLVEDVFRQRVTPDGQIDTNSFSATVRHDLRTPVNAIIGYSEMLLEDAEASSSSAQADLADEFEELMTIGHHLLSLINELISFVKGREAPKPSKADLVDASPHLLEDAFQTITHDPSLPEIPATPAEVNEGTLLVVDDKDSNRELLSRQLGRYGFTVETAENGLQALKMMAEKEYDTILLDVLMPELNGFQVLAAVQADPKLKHIPVIMISALDEIDSVVRCIEMGAQDYLQKPFNPTILKAKINATLERKRLRDREQAYLKRLKQEQEKSEKLLLNILPRPIAERLKGGIQSHSSCTLQWRSCSALTAAW